MDRRAKTQGRTREMSNASGEVTTEVSKASIAVLGIFAAIVGLWSLACIIGGMVAGGGPGGLIAGWFKAVSGY